MCCVLSPCLFNLYTEVIFRSIEHIEGISIGGHNINNLRYADDTVLLAENEEQLKEILRRVNEKGEEFGMKMNAKKTKSMVISKTCPSPRMYITIDGEQIKQVATFTYLGQQITEDGKNDHEIIRRISIARGVFNKMRSTLTNKNLALNTRKRILKCYVWATLLYGCETWTLTNNITKRIVAFEMWSYRRMLKISWTDKITNETIVKMIKSKSTQLENIIKLRKLRYFGHLTRRNNLSRVLLEGRINGRRQRGRPRAMWVNNISDWTEMTYSEAIRAAENRSRWRTTISSNPDKDGT